MFFSHLCHFPLHMPVWIHHRAGRGGAEACESKSVSTAMSIRVEHASPRNLLQGLSPSPNRHLCIPETSPWLVCLIQQTRHLEVVCMGDRNCMEFEAGHKQPFWGNADSRLSCMSILRASKEPVLGGQLCMPSSDSRPHSGRVTQPLHWGTVGHPGRSRGCMAI